MSIDLNKNYFSKYKVEPIEDSEYDFNIHEEIFKIIKEKADFRAKVIDERAIKFLNSFIGEEQTNRIKNAKNIDDAQLILKENLINEFIIKAITHQNLRDEIIEIWVNGYVYDSFQIEYKDNLDK